LKFRIILSSDLAADVGASQSYDRKSNVKILFRMQSLGELPSGAVRIFILKSPALGWSAPCGSSRYAFVDGCHARRVWARSVPFRSIPRGRSPREMDIANCLKASGPCDGSSTRPLYSTVFSLPFLLLSIFYSHHPLLQFLYLQDVQSIAYR